MAAGCMKSTYMTCSLKDSLNQGGLVAPWCCSICGKNLSRKQRLQSHLWIVHGIQGADVHSQYKLYEKDPSLPVPRSTKWLKKKRVDQAGVLSHDHSVIKKPFTLGVGFNDNFHQDGGSDIAERNASVIEKCPCDVSVNGNFVSCDNGRFSDPCGNSEIKSCGQVTDTDKDGAYGTVGADMGGNIVYQYPDNLSMHVNSDNDFQCSDFGRNFENGNGNGDFTCVNLHNGGDLENENCNPYTENGPAVGCGLQHEIDHYCDENLDIHDIDTSDNENDCNDGSDGDSAFDNDESSESVNDDSDFAFDERMPMHQIASESVLTAQQENSLTICALKLRHRLTSVAVNDIIKLKLCGYSGQLSNSEEVVDLFEKVHVDIYEVCYNIKCRALLPKGTNSDDQCAECGSVRYDGDQSGQKNKCYFASIPIQQQMTDILARPGIWDAVENYRNAEGPGLTDIKDGAAYKSVIEKHSQNGRTVFTVCFNTDGAQLYSSSHVDLWPLFLVVNELPPKLRFSRVNMITWGIWQSESKPNFNAYFSPLVQELNQLQDLGMSIEIGSSTYSCTVVPIIGIMDLQAKAPLLGTTHHNGQFGCITCLEEGVREKSGKGTALSYPPRTSAPALRTSESFCATARRVASTGVSEFGIQKESPLLSLASFDVIKGTVPDYMHGVLLGVAKKLMLMWFSPKFSKQRFSISKELPTVEARLREMSPNDYIDRMPKKLKGRMSNFKASEYQAWLLYFSVPCLEGILPEIYLRHYCKLVESIYILLSDCITDANLARAESLLALFYQDFVTLYGANNCGLNVHNVGAHLVWYVRLWGPLWGWSCFPYEDMNGNLLSRVHGTGNVSIQALRLLSVQKVLSVHTKDIKDPDVRKYVTDLLKSSRMPRRMKQVKCCYIAGGLHPCDTPSNVLQLLEVYLESGVSLVQNDFFIAKRIFVDGHVFFSVRYSRMKKKICHFVLLDTSPPTVGSVQYFLLHRKSQTCYAVYSQFQIDQDQPYCQLELSHLIRVQPCDGNMVIPVTLVREKLLFLKCEDSTCISRMANLHGLTI